MLFTDKTLTCRDCGASFLFTQGEQEFYAERGFTNEPSRCPSCRSMRRAERGSGVRAADRGRREMHPAVCSRCGKDTTVPFVPRGDKPVYCSECFEATRSGLRGRGRSW